MENARFTDDICTLRNVGNITPDCRNFAYVNYGLKKYFLKKCMELVKNIKYFTVCFDGLLGHISNCKQLDMHILYHLEIANPMLSA